MRSLFQCAHDCDGGKLKFKIVLAKALRTGE